MTRLQRARARREKLRETQAALEEVLDNLLLELPLNPSEALLAIIEYGVEGLAAQRAPSNRAMLNRLIEGLCIKHHLS
ncbi:hypothetical protein SQ03_22155 [Methylobacterium platani JCM 14648]|uniref:Uncharacterized protein n=1 Tax=Methylobacterium platani JCM 14648 TaxID=1295136 RepID=A0ABR5GUL3_9HYPH|nr:hypothetical protein SQ03_22155 [Methylobacterium platani JCM 14648]